MRARIDTVLRTLLLVVKRLWSVVIKRAAASWDVTGECDLSTNFYSVLGLRRGADGAKVKAAYRRLAKQFHPDFNAGDTQAEQRIKVINRAYQTLGDPEARAVYDAELARQRADARGRFLKAMATGVATFILTGSLLPMVTLLRQHPAIVRWQAPEATAQAEKERTETRSPGAESQWRDVPAKRTSNSLTKPLTGSPISPQQASPATLQQQASSHGEIARIATPDSGPQKGDNWVVPPPLGAEAAVAPSSDPPAHEKLNIVREQQAPSKPPVSQTLPRAKPATWAAYRNTRLGFVLRYPADVFTSGTNEGDRDDRLLTSKDGRALLRISVMPRMATNTVAEYRRTLMAERYADATFDYTPQRNNWFVLSGRVGDEMFYQRVTFSCDRRSIHGWLLVYPLKERPFFDAIVEEIHRSYDPGPNTRCGETKSEGPQARQARSSGTADMTLSE